ncbi:antibiotic biosynthesis monooxygenase family protein [Xanthobacter sp. TB0136]|uniref:antibiotic biosynthesis monooxygenase family protein n=1 Tax=Xanthobacter sp. TB0136 TaxID=3459177 RepID=UPI00403A0C0B
MIFEIAEIEVKPGAESALEAAVAQAAPLFRRAKGCLSFRLERTIERPQIYRLVVGWQTLEDHMVHFRESEDFQTWRGLAGPHFARPPHVEHVQVAVEGF